MLAGMHTAFAVTIGLASLVLFTQHRFYEEQPRAAEGFSHTPLKHVFRSMPTALKRLLVAECFVRVGEGLSLAFIILYVTEVLQFSVSSYGTLYAIQQSVAIAFYIPSGKLADVTGRKPLVALTFFFFALFPLAVKFSGSFLALVFAFLVGGLKEFGEPARKSLIVDLSDPNQVGRTVGMYYMIRNLLVVPAGTIGGVLWQVSPELTLYVSSAVGIVGLLIFLATGKSHDH